MIQSNPCASRDNFQGTLKNHIFKADTNLYQKNISFKTTMNTSNSSMISVLNITRQTTDCLQLYIDFLYHIYHTGKINTFFNDNNDIFPHGKLK